MLKSLVTGIERYDTAILKKVAIFTGKPLIDKFMYSMSKSGDGPIYFIIGAMALAFKASKAGNLIFVTAIAFAIELTLQKTLKHLLKRERPFKTLHDVKFLIKPPDKFSFPSGHTAGAFLMATVIGMFYGVFAFPVFVWAVFVGFSRVYNAVHYPSDVISGAILGVVSAWIGFVIVL